jgi:hypothetical protein
VTLNRYAKKRDENEPEIIEALEDAGCLVMQTDKIDLLVQRGTQQFLLEVKMPKGKLTRLQAELLAEGWRIAVVRSPEEALKAIGL